MKKTAMILALAALVSACGSASTTEANDSTAVKVDTVAVDTTAVSGGAAAPAQEVK